MRPFWSAVAGHRFPTRQRKLPRAARMADGQFPVTEVEVLREALEGKDGTLITA